VPIRATIVDNKGVPKVLASEDVYFDVQGPAEIVGGPRNHANPARTEFGTATALVRAKTTPGVILVKAYVAGLPPGEAHLASAASPLPLGFDATYAAAFQPPAIGQIEVIRSGASDLPGDVRELQAEVLRLRRELTSKEQDLMELRSKAGK